MINNIPQNPFPEEGELKIFATRRNRKGIIWHSVFQAATVVGIIALIALLYNIIISAFGYVVIQSKLNPQSLVLMAQENEMLYAPHTISSEDDKALVDGVANDPYAIGFFGYAYYNENADTLKALSINGVVPNAQTAADGSYPYSRPLFIYTAEELLQTKPEISTFINFYLQNSDTSTTKVGYFPASANDTAQGIQQWFTGQGLSPTDNLPAISFNALTKESTLSIAGSSTVYPLTREIAKNFRKAGFPAGVALDSVGSSKGFELFCEENTIDIVNASRPMNRAEREACENSGLTPLEFIVGTDTLVIVTAADNTFLSNLTTAQLEQIFTSAEMWSDVDPNFPHEPINRYIPGEDSGSLDYFAENTFNNTLETLPAPVLIGLLEQNLSAGLIRRLNSEQPLDERTPKELYQLVIDRVVEPRVVKSYSLIDSIKNKDEIYSYAESLENSQVEFRKWLNWNFLVNAQSSTPELAGVRTAILGSLWVIGITILFAIPLGVGAAIYMEEYASIVTTPWLRRINSIIQTNINNLAGVPSIIYGILGLAVFVRALEFFTSGTLFNATADPATANGRTIISAGLTLALLILPIIIINAQEALRAVPNSLRQASMGLGATRWQTIWHHTLPSALPGILTGSILAVSRAIGETAPLVVIGASTFITVDPTGPFSKFTTLPIQIYQWTARPQDEFRNIAAAAIIVLLILLLSLNASAVLLRNRYGRRLS